MKNMKKHPDGSVDIDVLVKPFKSTLLGVSPYWMRHE